MKTKTYTAYPLNDILSEIEVCQVFRDELDNMFVHYFSPDALLKTQVTLVTPVLFLEKLNLCFVSDEEALAVKSDLAVDLKLLRVKISHIIKLYENDPGIMIQIGEY